MRIRTLAAAAVLAGAALLGGAGQAGAHGDTIVFKISALGDGHTRTAATWANDNDPVTDKVAATLSAVAEDGRSVGPWKLEPVADTPGTFTTGLALPPGRWAVTVESGFPALGRGTADLTVTAVPGTAPSAGAAVVPPVPGGSATGSGPAAPAPGASAPAAAEAASSTGSGTSWVLALAAVLVAVAAVAVASFLLRRRRTAG
ncbi:hypothetical protein AB0K43_09270 [Kitasatospora sp. NPDC049258]|uniref:hypothetical protein n=1 Tax=Kitasatospora sp. NPDC049258 TaxID=3155394 RepID=UPI0034292240